VIYSSNDTVSSEHTLGQLAAQDASSTHLSSKSHPDGAHILIPCLSNGEQIPIPQFPSTQEAHEHDWMQTPPWHIFPVNGQSSTKVSLS